MHMKAAQTPLLLNTLLATFGEVHLQCTVVYGELQLNSLYDCLFVVSRNLVKHGASTT